MYFKLQKESSLDMTSKQHIIETKRLPFFKDLVMIDITPRDIIQWQNSMGEVRKNGEQYVSCYYA